MHLNQDPTTSLYFCGFPSCCLVGFPFFKLCYISPQEGNVTFHLPPQLGDMTLLFM